MNFNWTPERIDVLRQRRTEGRTCAEIAAELGCSKNAVIGKASRLGLTPDDVRRVVRVTARRRPRPDVMLLDEIHAIEPERGVPIYKLRLAHCRWVESSAPPWVFCGAPVSRRSYCAEHAARVYYKPPREEKKP